MFPLHALPRLALALVLLTLCPALARAQAPFELWSDPAPRGDYVLDAVARAHSRAELLALGGAVSTPCARFPQRPLPFFASRTIARPYDGGSRMRSFRLETCLRQAYGQGYENRTPFMPLACAFTGFGVHVKIALDPAGENVLQEYDAFLPPRAYARLGYDGSLDYVGVSGTYEQLASAQRDQRIVYLEDDDAEALYRAPFTVYVSVSMLHGTISGMGAYTAKVDGDGAVLVHSDVDGDGVIAPGGESSPNGANLAIVFHWGDSDIAP